MRAKNDYLLIEVEENKNKFAGEKQKPWYKATILSIGEQVKGTYQENDLIYVTPHHTQLIEDNKYVVRESGVIISL